MDFIAAGNRTVVVAGIFLISTTLAMPVALAQATRPLVTYSPIGRPALPALMPASSPSAPPINQHWSITPQQLDVFAELLGEPNPVVWQRLWANPGLVPIAAEAAQARMDRRGGGKAMTIIGFTILGVGASVAFAMTFNAGLGRSIAWDCDSACAKKYDDMENRGMSVGLVSATLGLALAIPGIIKLARQSEIESEAVRRYKLSQPGHASIRPPTPLVSPSVIASGKMVGLPLLSFSF